MMPETNDAEQGTIPWVVWDKKLELGIPRIDSQHRKLVAMCNELHEALINRQKRSKDEWLVTVGDVLRQAVNYTQTHFADEEKLMKACKFSGYEAHKQRHKEFVQTITQVLIGFDEMTLTLGFDFADYLRDWVLSHIACEDKQYCPVMRAFYHALQEYSTQNKTGGANTAPQPHSSEPTKR